MQKKLTIKDVKKCLWFWFGKIYIRLRDTDRKGMGKCISSGVDLYRGDGQAGHFIPNGSSKVHTWDEKNVNLQSFVDNVKKHGNVLRYEDGLRKKIGDEYVDSLKDTKSQLKKWTQMELEDMVKIYVELSYTEYNKKISKERAVIDKYIKDNEKRYRRQLYDEVLPKEWLFEKSKK